MKLRVSANGIGTEAGSLDVDEIATAAAFLRQLSPTKSVQARAPGSYGLKHTAESWGRTKGLAPYVSNGALIAAAVALGYPIRRFHADSLNVGVGVSLKDLARLRATLTELSA